jgi:hypothetical protein
MTLFPTYYDVNPIKVVWINPEDVTHILEQGEVTVQGKTWGKFQFHFASGETLLVYCHREVMIRGLLGLDATPWKQFGVTG